MPTVKFLNSGGIARTSKLYRSYMQDVEKQQKNRRRKIENTGGGYLEIVIFD